jgi:hypothetical protein
MSHVRARASEYANHAQRYQNINVFCKVSFTISKKGQLYIIEILFQTPFIYCYAHMHIFQDELAGRASRMRRSKFSGHLCISVLRNAVDVKQELH